MYNGIIINQEFKDPSIINDFKTFATIKNGSWEIHGIEIQNQELQQTIDKLQKEIKDKGTWYAHLYNDEELIVIFKNKMFRVTPHQSSWEPIIKYGKKLGIPKKQLDFWPNRFQDEKHYFKK